ncbi:MAG: SDR family oxidoreductase [Candidatus Bostrichicola ureolyticus]|nr:MAG: SDR family oxidoreductase [Candidatus Bostrichicola ureolyticus]
MKLLHNKKGIIFGALNEDSIAWKVAERAYEEGADIVLSNTPIALKKGNIYKLSKNTNSIIIPADATSLKDIENLFNKTIEHFNGKIDFLLHSIAMSINIRKERAYTNIDYNWLQKSWDISAVSFHKIMKIAWDKDAINEWGSIIALTFIGAKRIFTGYNDMADHKAYIESIARSFGYYWGKKCKVRVNTVSQSPTITTAGKGIKNFDIFLRYANELSPLGNASSEDCSNYIITLFSDLTKKVTMQNLYHDGGFSNTGISDSIMNRLFN